MDFALELGEARPEGIHRIADEQVRGALERMRAADDDRGESGEGIHDAHPRRH